MTRLAAILTALLVSAAALAQETEPETPQTQRTDPAAAKQPLVIDDSTIGVLRTRQAGSIILPDGKPPFPAVVVLHGCNGIAPNTRVWARRLASWGYAALIIDSFTPRGFRNVCARGRDFSGQERAKDAFAGAAYLRTRPDIDAERIGVLGYSHGGWTALAASVRSIAEANGGKPFAAAVALYPNCPPVAPPLASDVLILAAEADDWTPARRCIDLVARYEQASEHKPLLKIYPGAYHSFDAAAPERVYFGHRLRYDAAAADDSFAMTKQFLDQRLKRP
ncbi:MAG: dienelactone hydrolase family protein [Pseudolabrys sp.]|nr:dienelactone hydrolase family protein [Pseudolabrys sp.]MBV9953835.1 dienelactone hydrolase family protein [Pseudolabrys sp.]